MISFTKSYLTALAADEDGATLVEYGIAILLAIAVGSVALLALTGAINTNINATTAIM
jgi:Flp pilus assembly pilin Flp